MNGYLVTVGTLLDDLPIAFVATRDEALKIAGMCDKEDCVFHRTALEILSRDYSEASCAAISEFRDGLMIKHEIVWCYDDEE